MSWNFLVLIIFVTSCLSECEHVTMLKGNLSTSYTIFIPSLTSCIYITAVPLSDVPIFETSAICNLVGSILCKLLKYQMLFAACSMSPLSIATFCSLHPVLAATLIFLLRTEGYPLKYPSPDFSLDGEESWVILLLTVSIDVACYIFRRFVPSVWKWKVWITSWEPSRRYTCHYYCQLLIAPRAHRSGRHYSYFVMFAFVVRP